MKTQQTPTKVIDAYNAFDEYTSKMPFDIGSQKQGMKRQATILHAKFVSACEEYNLDPMEIGMLLS
jgi:hypothetical protein